MSNQSAGTLEAAAPAADLVRIPFGTPAEEVGAIMARDGGLILTGVLTAEEVAEVNRDLDPLINALPLANWGGEIANAVAAEEDHSAVVEVSEDAKYSGWKTKHLQHLLRYSKILREKVVGNPLMAEIVAQVVPGRVGMHSLFSSVAIEIHPGDIAQNLHRDADYMFEPAGMDHAESPNYILGTLLAMCDVTEEMGATRVIPGSHLWPDYKVPGEMSQSVPATMKAGDMLIYNAKTIHGGGANTTKDTPRRLLSTSWTFPWAVGEEAWPFVVTVEEAKTWPKLVQQYTGFRSKPYFDETPGLMWRVNTRPLEEKLGLDA